MKFNNCWLILAHVFLFWITISHGQSSCNDIYSWINPYSHPCDEYKTNYSWCPNGTYTSDTMWTGGDTYKYPEFNCCGCGKGWPLWFVPSSGHTAVQAVPEPKTNMTEKLMCNDTYRNITACTMKCKVLKNNVTVITLTTMNDQNFTYSNCTLDLNMKNNSFQYILQIPVDNYLVYFTNWTTNDYNLSCMNNTGITTAPMLCRYQVDAQPFELPQCPSTNITNRYIRPDCIDTKNWTSTDGYSCFEYEIVRQWCTNGYYNMPVDQNASSYYSYPNRNCCACGKGLLSPIYSPSVPTQNNSINSSEIGIMHFKNCNASANPSYIFDMKCLGLLDFIHINTTMNSILYNCPLDCFFNWNTISIKETQNFNVSRLSQGQSFVYHLTSTLFSRDQVTCESFVEEFFIEEKQTSTDFSSIMTTSEPVTTSQSSIMTQNPSTTHQPIAEQLFNCTNGKIGPYCNISVDACLMAKPCLNNGTCLNTNSSFLCLCPPFKFSGIYCENDIRPCKSYTCLSYGTCIETSPISFLCHCESGYEGLNCQSLINYCQNIQCQNNGQCRPSRLNFTCECTSKDYSGRYCEIQSSSLVTKQTVTRSFGYIAIIALVAVGSVIVAMDVLKYFFHIDPVDKERKRLQTKKQQQQERPKKHRPVVIRFIYVDKPTLETIVEEP